MEPTKFMEKGEILLGGFHVGSDVARRWDRYEQEEKIAKLTNAVDGAGFERRMVLPDGIDMFTGVEVTDKNILPNYELLSIPPAHYAVFEINCGRDIDRQFVAVDRWLDDNRDEYKRMKWDKSDADYIIIWSGRYAEENICEMWMPVRKNEQESFQ